VASYGDFFAERRQARQSTRSTSKSDSMAPLPLSSISNGQISEQKKEVQDTKSMEDVTKKRHVNGSSENGQIECLVYRDPFSGIYKKYIFSADGKYLVGGMMVSTSFFLRGSLVECRTN
jgi:nitrite reductase (NAD(P)H)